MRSKTLLSVIVGAAGLLGSVAVQAQEAPATPPAEPASPVAKAVRKMLLGADVGVAIPVGDMADGAGIGFGLFPRFEFNVVPRLSLTGRLGYVYHLEKNGGTFTEIPVLVGAKYDITDAFYGAVELGLTHMKASADFGGATISVTDDKPSATVGVGYRMDDLDFKAGLHLLDLGEAGDFMEIVISAGYNFWHG